MIALAWTSVAFGTVRFVDLCGTYDADYDDVKSLNSELDDDFFLDNDFRAARGALVTFTMNQSPFATLGVRLPDSTTTCSNGENCACAENVPLDDAWTYNIKLKADVEIGSNAFVVENSDSSQAVWVHQSTTNWTPVAGEKHITTGEHEAWRVAAAAGWALHRSQAVVCGDPFTFYTQTCPNEDPGTSCQRSGGEIYISSSGDDSKNVITHELGHWMSVCVNNDNNQANYGANSSFDGVCTDTDGGMVEKQNAGGSAIEGIAWYYAAVAFNQTSDVDCEFSKGADYDQDGLSGEQGDDEMSASCEGLTANSWAGLDYVDNECGGTLEDRGTQYDYLRAFWDAEQGQGLTTLQVFQIYADADPENWDGDGGGITEADDPQQRLEDAADNLPGGSKLAQWNNVDLANGIR